MMTTFELVKVKAEAAHKAACALGVVSAAVKNKALLAMADALLAKTDFIIEANDRDMQAARENGIRVPEDMEIVCVIDTKYNSMIRPTISSFSIPSYDLGAVSMRLMTKMLQNEEVEDKEKCLSYLITSRETTKVY